MSSHHTDDGSIDSIGLNCKGLGLSEAISKRRVHGLVRAYSLVTRVQIGVLQIGTRKGQSDS
jgi:hypothetical protein